MLHKPFFDPEKTYEENFEQGPFSSFADGKVFKNKNKPKYEVFAQKVYLPFGIPAGPLLNGKYVKAALDKGFDIPIYKTVRTHKYPSNSWPNVLSVHVKNNLTFEEAEKGLIANHSYNHPISITNSFGVPSYEPDFWQKDMADSVKYAKTGQFVIGSFQGTVNKDGNVNTYVKDFVTAARLVKETRAKVLEANLSCPNEGTANLLCYDVERSRKIVQAIKNEIGNTPLVIKIAYFQDINQLRKLIEMVGTIVDGISAINTIPSKIIDGKGNQALPGKGRLYSGVCGYPIKWAGLDEVEKLKVLRDDLQLSFTIFGVGGVTIPSDYEEYRGAGADVVMSATGAMWNPYLAQEIKKTVK